MTFEYMLNERERKGLELGLEQGRSEGRSEGEAKKQHEIARNLKDLGVGMAEIIKATGLTAEEVEKL